MGWGLARAGVVLLSSGGPHGCPLGLYMNFIAVVRDISLLMRARTVAEKESNKVLNKLSMQASSW